MPKRMFLLLLVLSTFCAMPTPPAEATLIGAEQPDEEAQPPNPHPEMVPPPAWKHQPELPEQIPSLVSSDEVGHAFLIAGIVGWIALALAYWMLENRQPPAKPS